MNWRLVGMLVSGVGLVLVALSILADPLGIGNEDGFGSRQIVGVVVGGVALVGGLVLMYAPRRGEVEPGPEH